MTNFSAAVFALTFGPVLAAILIVLIHHLLSFDLVLVASEDEKQPDVEPEPIVKQPAKRWVSKGVSFGHQFKGLYVDEVKCPKSIYVEETIALLQVLDAEGPRESEKHFKLIAKAHKRGSNKERGLHKAIVRKAGGKSYKKVCVLHSNLTGMRYAAYFENGKKIIYNSIDWK